MKNKILITLFLPFCLMAFASAQERTYKNSIGMEFALIPAGTFMMGADISLEEAQDNEIPRHQVTISKPFYIGIYEVTQAQWSTIMKDNPSHFKDKNNPVESVSWKDVQNFIDKLNKKEGVNKYRLPTEAEWEYTARAGNVKVYGFSDDAKEFREYGWVKQSSGNKAHNVGEKKPNQWGLYDTYGNVFEWVNDLYSDNYNINQDTIDPQGANHGFNRVFRGGSWYILAKNARVAARSFLSEDAKRADLGFRMVMNID